ncbi:MAG: hypothetical protein AB7I34_22125 [Rhizobiaceae bacterium]
MRRIILASIFMARVTTADAHDWYEDKIDPELKIQCCDGTDCRAIPRSSVRLRSDGGYTYLPHNLNIPRERVQDSPDEQFHICEGTHVLTNHVYLRCFFAPRNKVSMVIAP